MNGIKIAVQNVTIKTQGSTVFKKLTLILSIAFFAYDCTLAQSTAPASVTVGATYVSPYRTDVYPYQSGLHPKVDYSIHFRINKGTKFTVVDVRNDSSGTIQGYVITVWDFKDGDSAKVKTAFYQKTANLAKTKFAALKKIQDSIKEKQDSLKIVKAQLENDSISAIQAKNKLVDTKKAWVNNTNEALRSALNINAKNALVAAPKKNVVLQTQIKNFASSQANVKSKLSNGIDPDSATKVKLINTAMSLPLKGKDSLKKVSNKLSIANNRLDNANQYAHDALENFNDNKRLYDEAVKSFEDLKKTVAQMPNPNTGQGGSDISKRDPNAYKLTKREKNDALDVPQDATTEAALYDELEYVDSWANGWQFFVPAKDFSKFEPIYPGNHNFTWGFLTLPVKMRFDNNRGGRYDFEQNLNFGLTFGEKFQRASTSDISWNYLVGLSVVNVPLNDATLTKAATSTSAISTSLGVMFQYDKFQIGAFLGKDFAGSHANQFSYQGKTWLGFAIGVSLFGQGKTSATTQTQTSTSP